jgi:PAS domain S-box-containing protein
MEIPDHRSSEHPLRQPEERLGAVGRIATNAIIVVDDGGRIRLFNAAAERLFACSEQDAIGTHLESLIPPRFHPRYRAAMDHWRHAGLQGGDAGGRSIWLGLRSTGETFACEVTLAQCQVGGTQELIISVRDSTERKQAAKAARHRVAFERFLFDFSRAFIAIPEESIDANMTRGLARVGAFLEMDRVTLMELSHDRAAMSVAYSWHRPDVANPPYIITKDMQPWWLRQVLRGGASLASNVDDLPEEAAAEKEYLRQRGVRSAASIPLEVSGEIAGAISFATVHRYVSWTPALVHRLRAIGDILWNALKRRQAMEALLAARETARESEERFRYIANTAPVMIWMLDVDRQFTYVNQPWFDFTGWPPNKAPGHRWVELIHPDDVARCRDIYVKCFDQRQPFEMEHRLRRHDGEYRWILAAGVPRYGPNRSFDGYVGTAVDVTDRKLVEVALRDSHAALRERTVELEHRTAQLSRLASDLTLAEQHAREELAKTLHDGLQQLLVSAALNLDRHATGAAARVAGPDEPLVRAKRQLEQAIAAARSLSLELFPPVLHGSGLPAALTWLAERTRDQYGLLVQVSVDPRANSDRKDVRTLLFESVRELLFNAVKHAQVDRVTIDLSLDRDDALCISVADQGIGFDPAGLVARRQGGQAGWGLFSIRERLTLLGGRFDIESAPGHGTLFRLVAPRGVVQDATDAQQGPSRVAPDPPPRGAPGVVAARALRILMVDDHAEVRGAFRELLEKQPALHIVGEAGDGDEAIAEAHALRPDVILMDVSMPRMDGVEATRRIHAALPFIQILGLSTYQKTEDLHPIERAGAAGFFTKGADTQRLIDHLVTHASSLTPHLTERPTFPV